MTHEPLKGVRVLDLTNVLAGPFCCHQLAHMGADVIKIETPGTGDLARQLGADPVRNADLMGVSFLAQNPGKKSITLNLKSTSGKRILKKLVQKSDARHDRDLLAAAHLQAWPLGWILKTCAMSSPTTRIL